MRQRRLKDLDEQLIIHGDTIILQAEPFKGRWREKTGVSKAAPLYLEFGTGKGDFIISKAEAEPEAGFVAVEGNLTVAVRASEKLEKAELPNIALVGQYINNLRDFFDEGELTGIFLNFSDPWPKARHAKRRLTHTRFLESYRDVLEPGGIIEFKTDNDDFFDFSLEEIEQIGYEILEMTRDLHSTDSPAAAFRTEYEKKFMRHGKNINYVKFRVV